MYHISSDQDNSLHPTQPILHLYTREKGDPENNPLPTKLQPGDTVLVQNHTKGTFDPKYVGDYRVAAIKGNKIEVRPSIGGPTEIEMTLYIF